ncbi:YetF domain-containing protein [Legionella yabuuchiae]|uniref:YetF domain-containing protein n=1 Tax=Legionella yabuuchiae TaxID=376727 RepID=UPI001055B8FD|nr:YetF domain-containing protein [Legionella yabuuchiae]
MDVINDSIKMAGMGILIFLYAIFLLRIAKATIRLKRPFDFVIIILIGSLLNWTIKGTADLIPTLIMLQKFFAWISYYSDWLGFILKGEAQLLVENGDLKWDQMKASKMTENDLLEEARKNKILDIKKIKKAYLERDGNISFIE